MNLKSLEITEATDSLDHYARDLADGPLLLTRNSRAVAAQMPIDDTDVESFTLSLSHRFQAVIDEARAEHCAGQSLSAVDVRRSLGR